MKRKVRNIYQQRTKIQLQCRVCLTLSNNAMFNLEEHTISLEDNCSNHSEEISVREALEKVTASKVLLQENYPQYICPICLSFLKISLKFILQYEDSQNKLNIVIIPKSKEHIIEEQVNEKINDIETEVDSTVETKCSTTTVEIIFRNNKYSLSDLIVVENEENEQSDFNGFLNNLGKEISATFSVKDKQPNSLKETSPNEVSIAVRENEKLLTVKEVHLNEETNEIEYIVDDVEENETISVANITEDSQVEFQEMLGINSEKIQYVNLSLDNIENYIINTDDFVDDKNKENNNFSDRKKIRARKRQQFPDSDSLFRCNFCKKIYVTYRALKAHAKRVHFRTVKEYICELCGYRNNTLSGHKHHMNKHRGKKWVCNVCQKRYYTKAVLKVHMESHHNRRQHLCSVCGKGFNYVNSLTYHMRLHTGEKKYACHICPQRYSMQNGLKRHLLAHTGEKPYRCKHCGKPFFSKSETTTHELTHTDYRPYSCVYCNKGFIKLHNMKVHQLGHNGPHKCGLCSRTFIDKEILYFHYKSSHKLSEIDFDGLSDVEQEFENFDGS